MTSESLPLTALLSAAFVAFVVEADNEFEQRMPHSTARGEPGRGPWLISMAMWANCLRDLDDDGTTAAELERRTRLTTSYDGMRRWGYVTLDGHGRSERLARVRRDTVIRPTDAGARAREIWNSLPAEWRHAGTIELAPTTSPRCAARCAGSRASCLPICPTSCRYSATA